MKLDDTQKSNWIPFHHPDWSLPVVRRRVTEEWMDIMKDVGQLLRVSGHTLDWKCVFPNQTAYNNAMSRLRKAGLVTKPDRTGKLPDLQLTEQAFAELPDYHHPDTFWNHKWNGIWYTLIFDVPESERKYRDTLRYVLKRLRMGCLQKSVWITPFDIRPQYDDLKLAANIHAIAYLLESRTVLHRDTQDIVENAWNFDKLEYLHEQYLQVFTKNQARLESMDYDKDALFLLLKSESEAYIQCMKPDPLLPDALLPATYQGKSVFALHQNLRTRIAERLIQQ